MSYKDNEKNIFQLRRIDLKASHPDVKDVMKLDNHLTTLGRHASQDFFLDSKKFEKLISRRHAEIQRTMDGKDVVYTLYDKSLNGTYVNDIRVAGSVVLKPGDIVMFGHLNGINIKPGELGPRYVSEFKFVFERVGSPEKLPDVVNSTLPDETAPTKKSKSESKKRKKNKRSHLESARTNGDSGASSKKAKRSKAKDETEEEPCAAPKCKRPVGDLVNWVQCDDCDQWYHTKCMKVDIDALGDEDYHCGCK